jgi:hypothetical protein
VLAAPAREAGGDRLQLGRAGLYVALELVGGSDSEVVPECLDERLMGHQHVLLC